MPRAFIALDLPDDARDHLLAARRGLPTGRPTPDENLHLTLVFLDDQPMPLLEALHEELGDIRKPPVAVTLDALDLWGGSRPDLLVATVTPTEPLSRLHAAVSRAARQAGITLPRRRFRPHVTLARLGQAHDIAAQAKLAGWLAARAPLRPLETLATGFTLYRSTLLPAGARHEPLTEYELR